MANVFVDIIVLCCEFWRPHHSIAARFLPSCSAGGRITVSVCRCVGGGRPRPSPESSARRNEGRGRQHSGSFLAMPYIYETGGYISILHTRTGWLAPWLLIMQSDSVGFTSHHMVICKHTTALTVIELGYWSWRRRRSHRATGHQLYLLEDPSRRAECYTK